MQRLSRYVFQMLSKNSDMDAESQEICRYGIDILLYTIFSTLGLLFIGVVFRKPFEAAIITMVFYVNQTFGGGYHATTHFRCFLIMAIPLVACLLLLMLPLPCWLLVIFDLTASVVLFLLPLRLHRNKKYLSQQAPFFIVRYRCILLIETCLAILLSLAAPLQYASAYCFGMVVSAISRIIGIWQDRRMEKASQNQNN